MHRWRLSSLYTEVRNQTIVNERCRHDEREKILPCKGGLRDVATMLQRCHHGGPEPKGELMECCGMSWDLLGIGMERGMEEIGMDHGKNRKVRRRLVTLPPP